MKQTILRKMIVGLIIISSIGCVDNQRDLSGDDIRNLPKDQYFDFNTNQSVALNIDYCFNGEGRNIKDYRILFEIYDQNPDETQGDNTIRKQIDDKDIEPIYRAVTDKYGRFTGEMPIPASISKVWLYSNYLGTTSPIELTIGTDRRISFNQNEYIQTIRSQASSKTRGITSANQHEYLSDWHTLPGADWDNNGKPNNLSEAMNIPPANVLYNIKYVFRKNTTKVDGVTKVTNITDNYPELFNGKMTSDIPITKPTEMSLVFVNSSAAWYNTVGYYTYKTGTKPTEASIRKTIVFPNVSPIYKILGSGALVCGEEVKLKYWNEEKQVYEDKFPEGITIGWCLQGMGFKNKATTGIGGKVGDIIKGMGTRYSTRNINFDKQRTVSLRDSKSGKIVAVGFEDNIDMDYCDALFYIHTSEKDAIDPTLPELPEDPEAIPSEYTITYSGTLAFEDLWPKDGDYDMNDVMIKYTSVIHRMALDNRIYQIEDKFILQHCGGFLQNGFGYQFHKLASNNIKDVKIVGPKDIPASEYMKDVKTESGQSHPTIILFDDMTKFKDIQDETKKVYTVTVTLDGVNEKDVVPPYNPFIFIGSKNREKEVHLVNYPPTDKADLSLLGIGKDISRPSEQLYYVSVDLMPFAINVPVANLPVPEEGMRIDVSYPKFGAWTKSNGTQNKDWYNYPKK